MPKQTTPTPTIVLPVIPIQKFDDIKREFFESEITLADITEIAQKATVHYGFKKALVAVRVQLGPGKWVYVKAEPTPTPQDDPAKTLRQKKAEWDELYPVVKAAS